MTLKAVDLFAGTGWGVACKVLGIDEVGVEAMPEARATRAANGMANWLADVWDVLENAPIDSPEFQRALLIASPPCQTFSMAGSGAGRKALDEVLALIDSRAYLDVANLRAFGEALDMRTALVLTPLTYVAKHTPLYVVLEQVPQVLPVWQRMAVELERWGYSVVTGVLNAEQYGVPQTRKRAILIARADGVEARMPAPTHSAYYPRNPAKLDEGVEPWQSMAEALGRGMTARPSLTITSGGAATGGYEPFPTHARETLDRERDAGRWAEGGEVEPRTLVSNYSSGSTKGVAKAGNKRPRTARPDTEPATTLTSKAESMTWVGNQKPKGTDDYQQRTDDKPAPTITGGSRSAQWNVNDQSGTDRDESWPERRPATTVATRDLVPDPGHNKSRHDSSTKSRNDGIRVTVAEASALQTYPATFDWAPVIPVLRSGVDTGRTAPMSKTKAFLQIGNAVPPLLALRVLETLVGE